TTTARAIVLRNAHTIVLMPLRSGFRAGPFGMTLCLCSYPSMPVNFSAEMTCGIGDNMAAKLTKTLLAAATAILTPAVAFAHPSVGDTSGVVHGFGHPISGLDHILAMVMVGVFAWQIGGRALWLVPMTFLVIMSVGGVLGIAGIGVPVVEIGIA